MKKSSYFAVFTILCSLLAVTSKQNTKRDAALSGLDSLSLTETKPYINRFDTMGEGLPIFYNMYLSVEMSSLFNAAGAIFNNDLLNSTEKITDYTTSSKKAMNLGVYAVNLTYAKVFEQLETAGNFFNP